MKPKPCLTFSASATRQSSLSLAVAVSALLSSQVHAQTWDGGGSDTNWTTPENWSTDVAPVAGGTLTFAGTTQATNTNNFTADTSFGGLSFTNTGNGQNFDLSGNRITLGGNLTTTTAPAGSLITDTIALDMILSGNRTVNTALRHNLTFTGIISEDASPRNLTKVGTGLLLLQGDNTYTGTTTVNNGTLRLDRSGGTLADTSTVAVTTDTAILNVAQSDTIANLNLAVAATVSGGGTLTVTTAITPNIAINKTNNISASLAGDAYLRKTGQGTTILSAANSYTGGTVLRGANSKLTISGAGTLGSTSGALSIQDASAVLDLGGTSQTVGSVSAIGTVTNGTLNVSTQLSPGVITITADPTVVTQVAIGAATFHNLTMAAASTYLFDLEGGTSTADLANVTGALNITNGAILDLVQLGTYTVGDKFTLFAYTAVEGLTGTFAGLADGDDFNDAGGIWRIDYNDPNAGLNGGTGDTFVTITAVPEPSAAMLGGLGLLALLRRRRG